MNAQRPEWMEEAACRGQEDLMLGPEFEDDTSRRSAAYFEEEAVRIAEAKQVCARCPVVTDCLRFALEEEPSDGVWGGLTFDERLLICPICYKSKKHGTDKLGCSQTCSDLRAAEYENMAAEDEWDVHVSPQHWASSVPTMRTNPYCRLPRGANHSTGAAYKSGCRCAAARAAKMAGKTRRAK